MVVQCYNGKYASPVLHLQRNGIVPKVNALIIEVNWLHPHPPLRLCILSNLTDPPPVQTLRHFPIVHFLFIRAPLSATTISQLPLAIGHIVRSVCPTRLFSSRTMFEFQQEFHIKGLRSLLVLFSLGIFVRLKLIWVGSVVYNGGHMCRVKTQPCSTLCYHRVLSLVSPVWESAPLPCPWD